MELPLPLPSGAVAGDLLGIRVGKGVGGLTTPVRAAVRFGESVAAFSPNVTSSWRRSTPQIASRSSGHVAWTLAVRAGAHLIGRARPQCDGSARRCWIGGIVARRSCHLMRIGRVRPRWVNIGPPDASDHRLPCRMAPPEAVALLVHWSCLTSVSAGECYGNGRGTVAVRGTPW